MDKLKQWWDSRLLRERVSLAMLAVFLACALGFVALWEPAAVASARLKRDLPRLRQQAAELDGLIAKAAALRPAAVQAVAPDHRAAIERLIARMAPGTGKVTQVLDGQWQLGLTSVRIEQVVNLLGDIPRETGLKIISARIDALSAEQAVVSASLVLAAANP